MKILQIVFSSALFVCYSFVEAQEIKMSEYTFGEGLNFSTDTGNTMQITGYFQPYFETKQFTEADDNGGLNRFRMRRARLRLARELRDSGAILHKGGDARGRLRLAEERSNRPCGWA